MGQQIIRDLEQLEATWHHKSTFTAVSSGDSVSVSTDDKIFHYLNEGTDVRHAMMTPDFEAKTKVGSLVSGAGRGGLAYDRRGRPLISKKRFHFKGQLPREWTRLLEEKYQRDNSLLNIVGGILNDVLRSVFGGR